MLGLHPRCTQSTHPIIKEVVKNMYEVKQVSRDNRPTSGNPHFGSCQIYNPETGGHQKGCRLDPQLQLYLIYLLSNVPKKKGHEMMSD